MIFSVNLLKRVVWNWRKNGASRSAFRGLLFPPPNAHIDSKTCTKYKRTFISSNARTVSSDYPRIETETPSSSDDLRGKFNWREKKENNWRRREKINRRPQKQTRKNDSKNNNDHRSGDDSYLAKELHFPRALPPRNRREAQGCEIKITDELHHGEFFFSDFLWRSNCLISFLYHSNSVKALF